ncbi:MAG: polyprenol monophosphomannose synthase [Vicinamibacterales bacterium]
MRAIVIVPTYNERDNLDPLIRALLRTPDIDVLVVDDGSPDGTGQLADTIAAGSSGRVSVLHRTGTRGLGRSYVDGMRLAVQTDVTAICQMDADFSHNPADIPRLISQASSADLVIGSRYIPGGRIENWSRRRIVLSTFANRYVRAITRLQPQDCTSGFRCWRRDALLRLPLDRIASSGYAFQVEMAWEATAAGCPIVEVPITFVERRQGVSKLSWRIMLESMLLPWRLAARRAVH